ncbi:MAG: hypothetical protein JEZ07_06500 [Phycisphaerae bacterium]|nr:hypothetical protein [Phycisphaerae bacterium]
MVNLKAIVQLWLTVNVGFNISRKDIIVIKTTIVSIGMPAEMFKQRDSFGKKLVKPALITAAEYWQKRILPWHFKPSAAKKYNYRKRTEKTIKKKERLARRNPDAKLPLIESGATRRQLNRMVRIAGTSKKVTAYLSGPSYVHMYSKGGGVYLAGEITATIDKEAEKLAGIVDTFITQRLNRDTTKKVTRFR